MKGPIDLPHKRLLPYDGIAKPRNWSEVLERVLTTRSLFEPKAAPDCRQVSKVASLMNGGIKSECHCQELAKQSYPPHATEQD